MFTGIIEELGLVAEIKQGNVYRLKINAEKTSASVKIGDSVAVNGVCLTVTNISGNSVCFDVVKETVSKTTLAYCKQGSLVNLETALTLCKPMGGHFVSGHIDGIASISDIKKIGDSEEIFFTCPKQLLKYVVQKGSVALDGISLTVASVDENGFRIAVIPHTLSNTVLSAKRIGDKVNLETDILAKYTEKLLGNKVSDGFEAVLTKNGYI